MDKQRDFVLRTIEERGVKFVRLWFTDVVGTLKSVALAPAEVEGAFSEGVGFDGSAIEGLTRSYEADVLAHPDPTTFQILPWRGEIDPTARMFCDIMTPDGQPATADPRNVLKRALAKAADRGFTFYTHPEIEFYLLKSSKLKNGLAQPVDSAGYFDNVPGGTAHDFRRRSVRMLEVAGGVDRRYADALTMADNIMTFRTVIKEVAIEQGVYATFMPKPISGQPGSGMHTHMSLFEGDVNAFFDPAGQYQLSTIGRQFVAGLLKHAPEITAVTNQFVNSYKRLWGGDEAPSYLTWGHNNRSALVRVPLYKPGKGNSARVEYRAIDSAANPYLAFSLLLAAGLKGIEEGYELPPEAEGDVWAMSDGERRALGYDGLPASLDAALVLMEESELVAETLGEQVYEYVLLNKRREWAGYRAQVTPFELTSNLEIL